MGWLTASSAMTTPATAVSAAATVSAEAAATMSAEPASSTVSAKAAATMDGGMRAAERAMGTE